MTAIRLPGHPAHRPRQNRRWVTQGRTLAGSHRTGDDAADTLDEGAGEIVDTAVAAVHAALSTIGTDDPPGAAA